MDTFSPPFEPQSPPVSTLTPTEAVPTSAPLTSEPTQKQQSALPQRAQEPNNTWKILLILGLILFFGGTVGSLFLWLTP